MDGLVLFAHGSRVEAANQTVRELARAVAESSSYKRVDAAFLELGIPDLPGAVAAQTAAGVREIVVVPYFLTPGIHLQRDLPRIVEELQSIYHDVPIHVADSLDGHPALLQIVLDRAAGTRKA